MRSISILLVDDHPAVRKGIRSLLSEGCDAAVVCGEAADGIDAVEKVRSLHPDLVLMDISMPRMDGLQATRVIRRENPHIKVILVSQNDASAVSRQRAEVDAYGFLPKADLSCSLLPMIEQLVEEQQVSIHHDHNEAV
jgi:DNA-binding NarL/FixJ family response regulator